MTAERVTSDQERVTPRGAVSFGPFPALRAHRDDEIDPPRPGDPPWRSRHAHRSLPAAVADLLAARQSALGWTQADVSAACGISRLAWWHLAVAADRRPSCAMAEALIAGLDLGADDAARLRAVAVPNVGRSSPYRTR